MGSFTAMLDPYLKSCEGSDYVNSTTHQSGNVVEFLSLFAAQPVYSKKYVYIA